MGKTLKVSGGATIGWVYATWPAAGLSVGEEVLSLNVGLLGSYTFRREQVVSVDSYGFFPIIGGGIRIRHTVAEYPRHIVFSCLRPPGSLIKRIHEVGFIPEGRVQDMPTGRGIAVRWQTLVAGVALWSLLLEIDRRLSQDGQPGLFTFLALLMLFLVSTNIWWSRSLQALLLKPGRKLSEIKHWLSLLAVISGALCLIFGLSLFGYGP